jgi:hypothetical protein
MHVSELLILLAWLLLPPLGVGLVLLSFLPSAPGGRLWKRGLALLLLSAAVEVLFLVAGPASWSRYLGVRDVEILGFRTMWAPFACVAVAIAFLPVAAWSKRGARREL